MPIARRLLIIRLLHRPRTRPRGGSPRISTRTKLSPQHWIVWSANGFPGHVEANFPLPTSRFPSRIGAGALHLGPEAFAAQWCLSPLNSVRLLPAVRRAMNNSNVNDSEEAISTPSIKKHRIPMQHDGFGAEGKERARIPDTEKTSYVGDRGTRRVRTLDALSRSQSFDPSKPHCTQWRPRISASVLEHHASASVA
ncbi:hypothetical protein L226DRAFT_95169 [Lentinus tigrinus ALCF2SS1-7]|uniref:Uncharacterized protein n=1 Tax=Lentinus tigrinus ALCF2SS1-6 TaxID=1328759 RepID=A0A5C2RPV2_9APHY|nr:hypothetical protein L227DRAFT_581244 [Lentinus tigrinus ALCF2SS1-6]RPD73684.1 hypothetical protein L226DRAFT_95169 [Lentinus tigrinus ALCF2SS1-7]